MWANYDLVLRAGGEVPAWTPEQAWVAFQEAYARGVLAVVGSVDMLPSLRAEWARALPGGSDVSAARRVLKAEGIGG